MNKSVTIHKPAGETAAAPDPADGFAFMLIPTSDYGTSGVGVNPVGAATEQRSSRFMKLV